MNDEVWRGWPEITRSTKMGRLLIKKLAARKNNPFPLVMIEGRYTLTRKVFNEWFMCEFEAKPGKRLAGSRA